MIPTHNQQPPTPGLLGNPPPLLRQPLQGVVQQPSLLQGNTQAMQNLAADKNEDNIDEDKDIEIVASTDMDVGQKGISSEPEERSSSPESQLRGLSSELMLRMGPVPPHGPSKRTWLRKLRRVRKKFNTSGTKSSKQSVQSPQTKSNDSRFSKSLKARHTNPIPVGHTRAEATSNGKIKHIKQDQHKLGAIPNKRPSQSIRPSSSDSHSTKRFKTVPLDSKTRSRAELINGGKTEHKKQPQDKHGSMSNKKPPQSSQNTSGDSHSKKRSTAKRLDSVNKTQGRSDPKYFGETVRRNQGQDRDGAISNKKPPQSSQSMSGDSHSTKRSTAERLDSVHKTQGRPDPKYFGETIHRNQGQDRDGAISNKKSPQFSQSMSGDSHLTKRSTAERSVSIPITWAETEATGSSQIGISLSKTVGPSKQSSLTDKVMGIHQISEDSFEENIQIETSRLPVIPHAYSSSPSSTTTSSKLLPTPIEGKDNTWFTSLKKGLETPTQLSSSFKGHKPITTSHLPFMSGFDSHFHPDMIGWFSGKRPTPTIDPEHSIQLVGGILNFSDPEYYKDLNFMEKVLDELPEKGTWRFAVGVHPKFASEFTEEHFDSMMCHINHPLVMGVSEIGLDFTVPPERWPDQEALLIRVLSVGLCGMVLILHLRGTTEDLEGRAVHNMARCLLQKHCHKMQRMHLQSFSSDMSQVQSWIRSFPHCYFGITGLAQYFTPEQEEAVKAIPQDRLLLETDSPHFAPHPELDANYPAFLGDVGAIVAGLREIPLPTLMSLTLTNARRLYVSR
ncbi:putative deoxyribonuclease TATDN2 [Lytechinus pictus]|uniref:putative deoxyribonuclease TATDN2 n=1 Tax=Lytechinus pictus TaxID=7653 RepID=UPI0030B9ECBF